ncbi:DUF3231 family protein [Gracilibacillus sp. YIM 98692]|uniref:DUF3231 family protein n=1 Tax=Gracilibacillus sp. YIM 98692 TaxID=2663532 RepID=UPI0013D65D29|nr:DUF3231 family protein [Gracilibacillus sp. YIM 98692]
MTFEFKKDNIPLDSAEIANLWTTYMNDSMFVRVFQHFEQHLEDPEIRPLLTYAIEQSTDHLKKIDEMFKEEKIPIPTGFTENDVDLTAPRMFTDPFILNYLANIGKFQANIYSVALANSSRSDVRAFYTECSNFTMELYNRSADVLLTKGIHSRPPIIPSPERVEFVQEQSFLAGWFSKRRPLTTIEIMNLFFNLKRNELGHWLLTGFSQTARMQNVRDYMLRGKQIASKHVEIFESVLRENDLPVSMMSDTGVTNTTASPFSDKLMMFHTTALIAAGMGFYGAAAGTSARRDVAAHFVRLSAEIAGYAEDGANIMIKNKWLEKPPQAPNREQLANSKRN